METTPATSASQYSSETVHVGDVFVERDGTEFTVTEVGLCGVRGRFPSGMCYTLAWDYLVRCTPA